VIVVTHTPLLVDNRWLANDVCWRTNDVVGELSSPAESNKEPDVSSLFSTAPLGRIELANRLVMAPMTRNRAGGDGVPTPAMVEYYRQRASAGLIITEGIQPLPSGQGYPNTPGLHTDEQVVGWRQVTDAVHAAGGRIVAQLMHAGRIGHPDINGHVPFAPSAVRAAGQAFTAAGPQDFVTPRELRTTDIDEVIGAFADAARRAIVAGFDGVELHGANGYLINQFLATGTNQRTDSYGGSVAGRIRFAVDVVAAVSAAIGSDRVGLRLSPVNTFNDITDEAAEETFPALVAALAPDGLGFLHLNAIPLDHPIAAKIRASWPGTLIVNPVNPVNGADLPADGGRAAGEAVLAGGADLVSVGRAFLANPDLVDRLRDGAPLNEPDPTTFYGGDERGYTDYPALSTVAI
jgi:N-ethylmaleimide reductase